MKIIGRLFLGPKFQLDPAVLYHAPAEPMPALAVRFYSKTDRIDTEFYIVPGDWDSIRSALPYLAAELENYRILNTISGKKVFLQLREGLRTAVIRPGEGFLSVPFRSEGPGRDFSARLVLTAKTVGELHRALVTEPPEDPLSERSLKSLDRTIFQGLARPPDDLDEIILSLSDKNIQRLLASLIHKNIASLEMLASYIRGLGDGGQLLLANLARGVRQEVSDLVRAARFSTTYRWTDEVDYIIKRNLMIAVREMDLDIRGMELTSLLRLGYETGIAKEHLSSKTIGDWLKEFHERGRLRELMNSVDRRTLAASLVSCVPREISELFGGIISGDGVKLLMEDIEAARIYPEMEKQRALLRFLRTMKDLYFTPIVKKLDFETEVPHGISDSGALDLVVDEIGFAKTVYAMKNMPQEWLEKVLSGVFRSIYEDVISGSIKIKNFDDGRIPECRLDFLKAVYILSDEEKI
jgi:hypothetical protein